jgi:hypothetical protein
VIERRRIEQADVANAILIFRAKGGSGVGDDSIGSMGNGVREQREGPFLEQIVESNFERGREAGQNGRSAGARPGPSAYVVPRRRRPGCIG